MKKLVTFLIILTASSLAIAKIDGVTCGNLLYPANSEDQNFATKFFEIVELHKTSDPLLEGHGPSARDFSLDKIKFAFMTKLRDQKVDLVFFNWNLKTFSGLKEDDELSACYGSPVYILKDLDKKSVATQGASWDQLTNFSYIQGARYVEAQLKDSFGNNPIPDQILNWKPHPEFMDRSHPLRQTLDSQVVVLLSPSKELFFQHMRATEATRPLFEEMLRQKGGYINVIMGMMIHETFHVKQGEDNVNRLAEARSIPEDRKTLLADLNKEEELQDLMAVYAKIIFSLGDSLKNSYVSAAELESLGDLRIVIEAIKSRYPNAWNYIWNYEYAEGFAEYVSAFSMVQSGVTSLEQEIDLQKADDNNFVYRTGALGGLYLAHRLKEMPFGNKEDHAFSLWEIIINRTAAPRSSLNIQEIKDKYASYPFNTAGEITVILEYLTSTVSDM